MQITILAPDEVTYLARVFRQASDTDAPWGVSKVRVSQSNSGLMVAVGPGIWTPPMGKPADASGQYPA